MNVGILEAKNRLSELIDRVARGERVTITRRGQSVAELVPTHRKPSREEVEEVMRQVRETRSKLPPISIEQILEDRREGWEARARR